MLVKDAIKSLEKNYKPNDTIAFTIWNVEDVKSVREDLTKAQAAVVLNAVERNHDATIGVNWDTITTEADELFQHVP